MLMCVHYTTLQLEQGYLNTVYISNPMLILRTCASDENMCASSGVWLMVDNNNANGSINWTRFLIYIINCSMCIIGWCERVREWNNAIIVNLAR